MIHHSDRGVQYASQDYRAILSAAGITASMSRKADCYDNAPMESFFHTLKTELVHHRQYETRAEAQRDIFAFIEGFYNLQCPHSSLKYLTPAAYAAHLTATDDRLRNPDQLRRSSVAPPAPLGVQNSETLTAAG